MALKLFVEETDDGYTEVWLRSDRVGQGVMVASGHTKEWALDAAASVFEDWSLEAQDQADEDE